MALDLSKVSVAELASELEQGISALLSALAIVQKFSVFLPANVQTELADAVKILTAAQSILSKV